MAFSARRSTHRAFAANFPSGRLQNQTSAAVAPQLAAEMTLTQAATGAGVTREAITRRVDWRTPPQPLAADGSPAAPCLCVLSVAATQRRLCKDACRAYDVGCSSSGLGWLRCTLLALANPPLTH